MGSFRCWAHTDILNIKEIFPLNLSRLQNISTFTNNAFFKAKFRDTSKILFPHRLTNIWQRTKMHTVKASLWGCQPLSNVNAFVWPQMTDFIHFWFPLEMCCPHSYAWCQKDKEWNWNWNFQWPNKRHPAERRVHSFFSLTNSIVH